MLGGGQQLVEHPRVRPGPVDAHLDRRGGAGERPGEEPSGRLLVPVRRHQHVDDLAELVDRPVQVTPPTTHLHVRLVDNHRSPGLCWQGRAASMNSGVKRTTQRKGVVWFDANSGVTYAYGPATRSRTASTIKVAILGTLLVRAQDAKRPLTTGERNRAARMIGFSDNAATDVLWSAIGRGSGLAQFMTTMGIRHTVPGPGRYSILTETTTVDLTMLMRAVAYRNFVLTNDSRAYILQLMSNVTPSQRWGVSAAVRPGQRVALKNGWMVVQNIWGINSMGRIWGSDRDFVIAVLTNGSPTKNVGIATVEGATRIAMRGL